MDIKNQHDDINKLFDQLISLYKKHIEYENKLLNIRYKIKPDNHLNIKNEYIKHKIEHQEFLNEIKNLQKKLENHILNYDKKHIHKL